MSSSSRVLRETLSTSTKYYIAARARVLRETLSTSTKYYIAAI